MSASVTLSTFVERAMSYAAAEPIIPAPITSNFMSSPYLSNTQVRGRFQRRSADAADDSGAVAAGQRVRHFPRAIRTIKRVRGRRCGVFCVSHLERVRHEM